MHPEATRAEVQAFLERHVGADEAREFCIIMRTFAEKHAAKAKRAEDKAKHAPKKQAKKKPASRKTKRKN